MTTEQQQPSNDIEIQAVALPMESICTPKIQFVQLVELAQQAKMLETEHDRLRDIISWILGEKYDFPERPEGAGLYWWRVELRERLNSGALKEVAPAGSAPH